VGLPPGAIKTEGPSGAAHMGTLPAAFEKKLRRLEKNRESARGGWGLMAGLTCP
jgi:hypothetical protein